MLYQRNGVCCSDATVAQLVAQRIRNAWVAGSSPASGLRKTLEKSRVLFFDLMGEMVDIIFFGYYLVTTSLEDNNVSSMIPAASLPLFLKK